MAKPVISISTAFDYSVPVDSQIPLIAEAGFTHLSFGENKDHSGILSGERRVQLKALLRQAHLAVDTIHGPQIAPENISRLKETINAASDLEVPVIVCHAGPWELDRAALQTSLNNVVRILEGLEPALQSSGIKLALENVMPGPATELAVRAVRQLKPRNFGFCYDSSHEQIDGPRPFELLDLLGERIIAVHLSDRIREFVDHVPPGEGFIDWEELTSLLKKTSFKGPLLFEVMVEHSSVKETLPFLKLVYEKACRVHGLMQSDS